MHTVLFCLQFLASPEHAQLQAAIQRQIAAECGAGEPGLHHALPLLRATLLGECHVSRVTGHHHCNHTITLQRCRGSGQSPPRVFRTAWWLR